MKLSKFSFDLDESFTASDPAKNRDECKLMVVDRATKTIKHKKFKEILNIFDENDVLVLNNTKVFPARIFGNKEKTGAVIEVFLMRELNRDLKLWDVLVDPARKIRVGNKLYFGNDELVAEVVDNTTSRGRTIRFINDSPYEEFKELVYRLGETPIPKYINRKVKKEDDERYQTVFAKVEGAIAPPSAGLHFSRELLMRLDIKGVKLPELTLHLGHGTFRTIDVEDITKHKMDSEYFNIPDNTANIVNKAKIDGKRVIAVGSSVLRALESSISSTKTLNADEGWTDKFIYPPYDFSIPTGLLTNFHAPESTLMILSAAFADYDFLIEAYEEALKKKYSFQCYGDAMLIL